MKVLSFAATLFALFSCNKEDEPYYNRYFLRNTLDQSVQITLYHDSSNVDTSFILAPWGTFEHNYHEIPDHYCEPPFWGFGYAVLLFENGLTKTDTQCEQYGSRDTTAYRRCLQDKINIFNKEMYRDTVIGGEPKWKKNPPCRIVYYIGEADLAEAK